MAFLIASPLCEYCWFIQHIVSVVIPFILMEKIHPKLDVDIYVYMYLHLSECVCFLAALACFAESKLSPVLIFELLNSQV